MVLLWTHVIDNTHGIDLDAWYRLVLGGYSEVFGGERGGLDTGVLAGVPGADPGIQECTVHLSIHLQCVHIGLIKSYMSDI